MPCKVVTWKKQYFAEKIQPLVLLIQSEWLRYYWNWGFKTDEIEN